MRTDISLIFIDTLIWRQKIKQVHPQKYFKTTSFDNVFLNLCNFWNIAVSQGNAATYVGQYNTCIVGNFVGFYQWKNLENRSNFREVIDMTVVSCCFFDSQCIKVNNRHLLQFISFTVVWIFFWVFRCEISVFPEIPTGNTERYKL